MAGGEIIGKFCILTLVVFFFCRISWAQAPLQIRCVDKLCKGHIGHGVVSQNYNGDEKNKLRFKEGEKLTIIGVGDNYFLARSSDNEAAGLVAKHFIKRPEITGEPEIEVEVASLLNSQPPIQDAKEVEPTPPVGCMVDGTSVADPEVCSQTSSVSPVDVSSDDSSGTTTVSTPALPEDATTASLMTFISKTIEQTYSTFASAIDPSERSREIVPNTETVTQEKSQEPSNSLGPNIAADIASTETSDEGVPENLAGEANPQVVVAKEPGVDNPVPQNLSDADTAATSASPEPLVKNEEKVSVQPTVPPPAAQGKETTDEKSESGVGTNDSVHETAAASEVVREEPQGNPSEVVTEKAPPQEPPPASTEAPSIVKEVLSSEKSESGPPAPEKLADATSGDGQAPGSPKIKEPTLPNPTPETGSSASVESVIKPSEGVLAPSSGLPVTDGSPASQTKELPKPKVTAGNKPPKDLPPANRIRPTTAGHSHFHTRNAHAHSHDHGHSHGHAHGHSHSHGHSHHDHVAPIAPTPEEQNSQSYSYPGEKPVVDRVPEKPTQAGPPAEKPTQPGPPAEKPTQPGPPAEKPTQPGPPAETTQPVPPAEKPTQSGLPAETTQPAPPAENTPRGAEDKPSITPEEAKSTEKLGKKEPEQYKVNTVEQICERNDGVGCDGEPVSTKPAEQKIPSSKPRTEDSALREYVGLILSTIPEPVRGWFMDLERSGISSHVIVLTALCGVLATFLVAFFSFITHSSKESALLDYVARLEQQLFTLKKEREVLLEEPRETTQVPDEILERHEEQIRVLQSRKAILESELACSKESILQYREALREAQETIAGMEVEYSKKQEELMEEVNELRIERASSETILEEKDNKMSELRDTNAQLLQEAQIWDERLRELTAKLDEVTLERDKANKQLSASATEIESLKTGLKSLSVLEKAREAADDTEDEDEVIARLLEVQTVSAENESLKERNAALEEETEEAKAQLEKWRIEVESLKNDVKQALKQKQDSEQKLQVLTDYFKDKELTLQRDVVKQESLRQQKENDALGINEQLELYREQNITIQTQLTAVKEELEISERRYKRQLMEHEKRAHDNWMAYKNASKTVEELQNELQILRQQLNQFQKDRDAVERMVNLPQNRPRPPPPLPLPKGVIPMGIPPIPLPNGVFKDLPSPPMGRYIEGARRTPPAGVPLPSVLYQSKALSSRHSSDHSVRSGGSRGGIVSPDLRRSSNHRRSDRGDRSKDSNR